MNRQREYKYVRTLKEIAKILEIDEQPLDSIEDLPLVDQALAEFVQLVRDRVSPMLREEGKGS
jgi:hypothetical protein